MKNKVIEVQNVHISISKQELDDYICITDIAKAKSGDSRCADIVKNWFIIPILKWSNSTTLKQRQGYIHLY